MIIKSLQGQTVLNSIGEENVGCKLTLSDNKIIYGQAPTGISKSKYEDPNQNTGKTLAIINQIVAPDLIGKNPNLTEADQALLALEKKTPLGFNAMLPVSIAVARAHAWTTNQELYQLLHAFLHASPRIPTPIFYAIPGGAHAKNNLSFQEILFIPKANSYKKALQQGLLIQQKLIELFIKQNLATDETNIFCWPIKQNGKKLQNEKQALNLMIMAIEAAGLVPGKQVSIGIDAAASQIYDEKEKQYTFHNEKLTSNELINLYQELQAHYPISFLEDALAEDDEEGWIQLTKTVKNSMVIIGEDLFASNPDRIKQGIYKKLAHGAIIKPGQTKTVSRLLESIKICKQSSCILVTAPRSCETQDTFVADLTAAAGAQYYKTVACHCDYHMKKNYRLIEIEEQLSALK